MTLPEPARTELRTAMQAVTAARRAGDPESAWRHLERAHILSQRWAWPHLEVHGAMLVTALSSGDVREVGGQVLRLVVAAPGSVLGRFPEGNSGRARVSMFAPMPIPDDLQQILSDSR